MYWFITTVSAGFYCKSTIKSNCTVKSYGKVNQSAYKLNYQNWKQVSTCTSSSTIMHSKYWNWQDCQSYRKKERNTKER